jgi:hypothetical protein
MAEETKGAVEAAPPPPAAEVQAEAPAVKAAEAAAEASPALAAADAAEKAAVTDSNEGIQELAGAEVAAEQPTGANTPLEYKQGDNIKLPDGTSGQFVKNEGDNVIVSINGLQKVIPVSEFVNSDYYVVKPIESGQPPTQAEETAAKPVVKTEAELKAAADLKEAEADASAKVETARVAAIAAEAASARVDAMKLIDADTDYMQIHNEVFGSESWEKAQAGINDDTISQEAFDTALIQHTQEAAEKFVDQHPEKAEAYAADNPSIKKALEAKRQREASAAETKDNEAKLTPEMQKTIDTQVDKRIQELGLGSPAEIAETIAAMLKLLEDKGSLKKEEAEKNKKLNLAKLLLLIIALIAAGSTLTAAKSAEVAVKGTVK